LLIETIIYHNVSSEVVSGNCEESRCSKHVIVYDAPMTQIIALIEQSTTCRQFVKVGKMHHHHYCD